MELCYKTTTDNNAFTTVSFAADDADLTDKLCECKIDVDPATKTWTISSWYTTEKHKHHGYGKLTLQECLNAISAVCGMPDTVEYIWNGANQYVFDWLEENFGALSKCPIAVQKYASDDDWESHIYVLNREKFLQYFSLAETA
ncbi:MAG: hypothetical protein K6E50_01380 [Lachnospiraceae bacterium]|nr:hypothetical protein [Lachnospiraceae bacterium]